MKDVKIKWGRFALTIALTAVIGFSFIACDEGGDDNNARDPVKTITFSEVDGWNVNSDWARWGFSENLESFDSDKVYILSLIFSSNINIDYLSCFFSGWNEANGWKQITIWKQIKENIVKGTEYNVKIVIFPNEDAYLYESWETSININAGNRNEGRAAILYI